MTQSTTLDELFTKLGGTKLGTSTENIARKIAVKLPALPPVVALVASFAITAEMAIACEPQFRPIRRADPNVFMPITNIFLAAMQVVGQEHGLDIDDVKNLAIVAEECAIEDLKEVTGKIAENPTVILAKG